MSQFALPGIGNGLQKVGEKSSILSCRVGPKWRRREDNIDEMHDADCQEINGTNPIPKEKMRLDAPFQRILPRYTF
jgi:hypothetical protein